MRITASCVFMLSAAVATPAVAQMKPGLWEMTMKSDAMKNMPKLSSEHLEQIRKMGIDIPQNGGIVSKVCITREMAERNQAPAIDMKEMGCQSKNLQRSGNSYTADIVCNGADLKGEGKAKGSFADSQSFASTYDFKGLVHGQPVSQRGETSGKWLAADCGSIKPMADALPKK